MNLKTNLVYTLFIFFLTTTSTIYGQLVYSERITDGDLVVGTGALEHMDPEYTYMQSVAGWGGTFDHKYVRNTVSLGLVRESLLTSSSFTGYGVEGIITYYDDQFQPHTLPFDLEVNYNTASGVQHKDQSAVSFSGGHFVSIEITSVTGNAALMELRSDIEIMRYYTLNTNQLPSNLSWQYFGPPTYDEQVYELRWDYMEGAVEYEVEWVFINNYQNDIAVPNKPTNELRYDFKHNSTRISTRNTYLRISDLFERGYIVYRVRAVGRTGTNYTTRVEGKWSSADVGLVSTAPHTIAVTNERNNNLNWSYSVSYLEGDRKFESVSYSDGLGFTRQVQARNNTEGVAMVQETYYDHYGRPAVSALPAPAVVDALSTPMYIYNLDYKANFNQNTTGNHYSRLDFDLDGSQCSTPTGAFNDQNGAGQYYSSNNPIKDGQQAYVPDGEGYPLARVEYMPDNTGRIKSVGAAGPDHQIGTGHETRYEYGTPSQQQLDNLFGVDVGLASRYQRNVVTDANGQKVITYIDPYGRVVATSLSGSNPTGLDALPSNIGPANVTEMWLDNTIEQTYSETGELEFDKGFTVESPGIYQFTYSITPEQFTDACLPSPICYDCKYDLVIEIIEDECTGEVMYTHQETINGIELDTECDPSEAYTLNHLHTTNPFLVNLPLGSYKIKKTLKVSQESIDYYTQMHLQQNTCLDTYEDFYNQFLQLIDFSGCDLTYCDVDCIIEHGTEADFILGGGTSEQYQTLIANCVADCETAAPDICASEKRNLQLDFYPGGQYATYEYNALTGFTSTDPLSILNLSNTLDWQNPITPYLDNNGNPATIIVSEVSAGVYSPALISGAVVTNTLGVLTTSPRYLANLEDFIMAFQLSWTESFVTEHPEYCYTEFCTETQFSHDYDHEMRQITTLADAISQGFINPIGIGTAEGLPNASWTNTTNLDPLWVAANNPLNPLNLATYGIIRGDLIDNMEFSYTVHGEVLTLWELAYLMTYCPEAADNAEVLACLANFSTFGDGTCAEDLLWENFRSLYFAVKSGAYNELRTAYAIENGCYNGCIGNNAFSSSSDDFNSYGYNNYNYYLNGGQPCSVGSFANYENKTPHFYSTSNDPLAGLTISQITTAVNNAITSNVTDHCNSVCAANATNWLATLSGCAPSGVTWAPGNTLYNNLYAEFVELCTLGCDATHPNGSISTPSGITTTNGNSTLEEILADHLPSGYQKPTCSAYLITSHTTYAQSALSLNLVPLDNCACDKIAQTYNYVYTLGLAFPPGVTTIEELFFYQHGFHLNNIEMLHCECQDLPSSVLVPATIACAPACLTCENVASVLAQLELVYGTLDPEDENYETLLQSAINQAYGYHLSGDDYADFIENCDAGSNADCSENGIGAEFMALLNGIISSSTKFTQATSSSGYPISLDLIGKPNLTAYFAANSYANPIIKITINQISFWNGETFKCQIRLDNDGSNPLNDADITSVSNFQPIYPTTCSAGDQMQFSFTLHADGRPDVTVTATNSCFPIGSCVCNSLELCDDLTGDVVEEEDCVTELLEDVAEQALEAYENYIAQVSADFAAAYREKCMSAVASETISVTRPMNEYHYTLFYYDQAGNLVQTVPPKGIDPLFSANLADVVVNRPNLAVHSAAVPDHKYKSTYRYNTFDQVVTQETTDGGITNYWYDYAGRIAVSQNAKQLSSQAYSYVRYDALGRLIESGEIRGTTPAVLTEAIVKDPTQYNTWISSGSRGEVTRSYYDQPLSTGISNKFAGGQQHLRNRIATVAYYDYNYTGSDLAYDHATHYTYDLHGNVLEVIQDNKELEYIDQNDKRTKYEFELISGNVNKVSYQEGEADAYYHKYTYDADNRLEKVSTSRNDYLYDQDAHYHYYQHGPLARTELGDWQVQGTDYAYTINGWIKGVNGNQLNANTDMGKDGSSTTAYLQAYTAIHKNFGRDAFGFTLGYFEGDYASISSTYQGFYTSLNSINTASAYTENLGNALYNGNIAHMATALMDETETPLNQIATFYSYDQLHRIKSMDAFLGASYSAATNTSKYATTYSYDANGNLKTLTRQDHTGAGMDNFRYYYQTDNNKLDYVDDPITGGFGDLETGQAPGNYTYDAIGQLTSDVQEGISLIQWRADGKISKIHRSSVSGTSYIIEFKYDAFGRRVLKLVKPSNNGNPSTSDAWEYTYYAYDAGGNVMAVYSLTKDAANTLHTFTQKEAHIYGSSRLAVHNVDHAIATFDNVNDIATVLAPAPLERNLGNKFFELANHLGNVLAVVTDRKLPQSTTYYTADVISYSDYYPFGMQMPDRHGDENIDDYRYGFNGMEKDDEVKGSGNSYDFGARMYDSRLGRWLSIDPHAKRYPGINPYNFSYNNPIIFNDPDGKDGRLTIDYENKTVTIETTVHLYGDGNVLAGQQKAAQFNQMFKAMNNERQVIDPDNPNIVWTVKFDVKFVYDECLDQMMETVGEGAKDEPSLNTVDNFREVGAEIPMGDNIYKLVGTTKGGNNGEATQGGNAAYGIGFFGTVIHEVWHTLGFDERYIPSNRLNPNIPAFVGSVNATGNNSPGFIPNILNINFVDLLDYSLNNHCETGCYEIGNQQSTYTTTTQGSDGISTDFTTTKFYNTLKIDNTNSGKALTEDRVNSDVKTGEERTLKGN